MDIKKLKEKLTARGYVTEVVQNKSECADKVMELISPSDTVGFGGSVTMNELNIPTLLVNRGNKIFHTQYAVEGENTYKEAMFADWYLSSVNAVVENGDMINIDGRSNRIASIVFGAQNVLLIFGINKIVSDFDSGINRIRNYVAPLNARRLNRNLPCAITGKCNYCNSDECMCNNTLIQHHPSSGKNVYIIIVNENLGY